MNPATTQENLTIVWMSLSSNIYNESTLTRCHSQYNTNRWWESLNHKIYTMLLHLTLETIIQQLHLLAIEF